MKDTNECRLSGSIEKLKQIATKTGTSMAEIILLVRQDRFRVVAHGNVADFILGHGRAGDRVSVTGSMSVSNWKDEATGQWRNSFAVTAWCLEIGDEKISYERKQAAPAGKERRRQTSAPRQRYEPPVAQDGDYF